MNILEVLRSLAKEAEAKQEAATRELEAITAAIEALNGHDRPGPRRGRRPGHRMSAAARRRISIAQKLRWAKNRKRDNKTGD
jgi:hypothetical protein